MMSARRLMNNLRSTTRRSSTLSVFLYAISGLKSIWPRWRFSISLAWSNGALLTGGGNRKSFRPSGSHTHKGLANSRSERGGMEMDRLRGERKLDKKEEVDRWGNIDERRGPKEGRWNVEREKRCEVRGKALERRKWWQEKYCVLEGGGERSGSGACDMMAKDKVGE